MKKLKILVTGGGGFIGRHITKKLVSDGHYVTIVSTGSEPESNAHKVLYTSLKEIDWKYVTGQDVVIHQMANNDTRCMDTEEMYRTNFVGPIKLFDIAYKGGCRKFVYASSTAVYGNSPSPYTEESPIDPLTPYAFSKSEFDKYAMMFAKSCKNTSVIGLRYCNVYGPGEDRKGKRMSMIGQMIRNILSKKKFCLFKDGTQKRDWVYVDDVVQANILSMNSEKTGMYNIGSGKESCSFNQIIDTIYEEAKKMGKSLVNKEDIVEYIDCPFPESYQSNTENCIDKAIKELNYSPEYDLSSGIKKYIQSFE